MTAAIAEVPKEKTSATPIAMAPPLDANSASVNIPVARILRSPFNRKPEVNDDFIANIRQYGVLQPIIVREVKIGLTRLAEIPPSTPVTIGETVYELVAGERRWLASKKNNKPSIPAIIRVLTDIQVMEIQIAENDHRDDYSVMDRAESYSNLRAEYMKAHKGEKGWTEEKCMDLIASRLNQEHIKGRTVQQVIALRKLEWQVQAALRNGELEQSHGYELCRRSEEEQLELLKWIRQQTQHSQGDVPSVRRLKLEIRNMDIAADEKRRQEKLFKDPQPGTATTKVPTIEEAVYQGALKLVREVGESVGWVSNPLLQRRLNVGFTLAAALLARMEEQKIVGPIFGDDGRRNYIRAAGTSTQTSASKEPDWINKKAPVIEPPKPPTPAQIKRAEKERQEEQERFNKQQAEHRRKARIDEQYRAAFFVALASKAHVCSRLLTHVVPALLVELWNMDDLPVEKLGREVLQWPEPKGGGRYSQPEIESHAKKHTRKFTGNLLVALFMSLHLNQPQAERLAKYFGVDPKKLRQKAATTVKEEDAKARLPKTPTTQKEKQLHCALHHISDAAKRWDKLRRQGASDSEIRAAVAYEFGLGGSSHGDEGRVSYKGGKDPAIFFNKGHWSGKPSLKGAELVAAVRDLLKIPEKGDVDA